MLHFLLAHAGNVVIMAAGDLRPYMVPSMAAPSLPSREQEQALYRRLLDGDAVAPSDLADAYYERLLDHLRRKNSRRISDDLLADAAYETWRSICKNPAVYDGTRSLWGYLCMSAQADLRNAIAKQSRRYRREKLVGDVELLPLRGNLRQESTVGAAERDGQIEKVLDLLPSVVAGLTEGEILCVELLLAGERKTARFAEALGITDRPPKAQKTEVKRVKDKLKQRLKRAGRNHGTSA